MRRDEDIHELEEEREEEEHQEEQYNEETPIEKLKKIMSRNKKYLIGGVVVVFGLVVLLMPKKGDKELKDVKTDQTQNIDLDELANEDIPEDEEFQQTSDMNMNQSTIQQPNTYNNDNLPGAYENDEMPEPPDFKVKDYSMGSTDYPSIYESDKLDDKKSKKEGQENKKTPISFNRNQKATTAGEVQQGVTEESQQTQGNNQGQTQKPQVKNNFLLNQQLTPSLSPYEAKAGTVIPATLSTAINSDLPGDITAIVREDIFDTVTGRYLLIPKGSRIFGMYDNNIIYGQNRLVVIWQRIQLPNGYTINLEGMQGVDITGKTGITGKVNNHTLKLLRSVVLSSLFNFISNGISVGYSTTKNNDNVSVGATVGGKVADDASSQIQNAGDMIIGRDLQQQPTIQIKAGTRFNIMVNKDMILYPYSKLKR